MTFNWHFFNLLIFSQKLNLREENEYETHEYFLLLAQWERSQDCFHFHLRLCKEYLQRAQFYSAFQQYQRFNEKMYRPGLFCRVFSVSAKAFSRAPSPPPPPGQRRGPPPRHLRPLRNFSSQDSMLPPLSQVADCKNIYDGFRFQT